MRYTIKHVFVTSLSSDIFELHPNKAIRKKIASPIKTYQKIPIEKPFKTKGMMIIHNPIQIPTILRILVFIISLSVRGIFSSFFSVPEIVSELIIFKCESPEESLISSVFPTFASDCPQYGQKSQLSSKTCLHLGHSFISLYFLYSRSYSAISSSIVFSAFMKILIRVFISCR